MPLTTFAGGRLFGARHGHQRPWVLALHGWQRSHRDFTAVLDGLDAIALDLPGFGAAPPPPEGWSTSQYADWVAPVLGEMADAPVVLGHSFGGRVAVQLAAAHPQRVGAMVLTGVPLTRPPGAGPSLPPLTFRAGKALHRAGLLSKPRMDALRQRYGSPDYRAATAVMRQVLVKAVNEDYLEPLSSFPRPVELVWGEEDTTAPVAAARAAAGACADGRLTELAGVGHFTAQQAPDELRLALERHRPAAFPARRP